MKTKTHELKTHPAMFDAAKRGVKRFEVRKDDHAFQTGDRIIMRYFDPEEQTAFPRPPMPDDVDRAPIMFLVTFVLRGGQYGVEPGHVVLSLEPIE